MPSVRHLLPLGLLAATLGVLTACLEGFERLETRVEYDPFTQVFHVERRFVGVGTHFLGCWEVSDCVAALDRARALSPDPSGGPADRLVQRLLDSGATDIRVELQPRGEAVDALVRYDAPLGSSAAEDTMVHAEWSARRADRGDYYLVVDAPDSIRVDPPRGSRMRRVARPSSAGADWLQQWVLPARTWAVDTTLAVGASADLFAAVPGLSEALGGQAVAAVEDGDIESGASAPEPAAAPAPAPAAAPAPAPAPPPAPPPAPAPAPPPAPAAAPAPAPTPAPAPAPATRPSGPSLPPEPAATPTAAVVRVEAPAPAPAPAAPPSRPWLPPDPASPAKALTFDVRVTGGGLSAAAATQATQPLLPKVARCFQDRHAEDPAVAGSLFLGALVRADGFVVSTSIYGQLKDLPLRSCLELVTSEWTFPAWGSGDGTSEVALPIVFHVETPPPVQQRRRR